MSRSSEPNSRLRTLKAFLLGGVVIPMVALIPVQAQEAAVDEVVVSGIRKSLEDAIDQKRNASSLVEVILAEDIGKLPDQNLAEVLENVTGIQITRTAGVGTGVQIRGTNSNRTEINGVTTIGSGSGRGGIDFEDVPAAMIAGVEVIKSPEAKTIEGAVGGTINLRTLRPLDLNDDLISIRLQSEDSSLTTDGMQPRMAGTFGKVFESSNGQKFGAVASISLNNQDVTAFRPRADRDNDVGAKNFLDGDVQRDGLYVGPQFFVQDYDNFEYETTNFSGSFEAQLRDNLKILLDVVNNEQERFQESSRIQTSGISASNLAGDASSVDEYQLVDFGSVGGQDLGSIRYASKGTVNVQPDGTDGNLRFSGDTNTRITTSEIYRLGAEWEQGRWSTSFEVSTSTNDTKTPSINTTLNFINPNVSMDADQLLANGQANDGYKANENGTPFVYDLTDGLTFGIAPAGVAGAPTSAQLLDPANVVLRDVNDSRDTSDNEETAYRADFSYDLEGDKLFGDYLTSVDFGYRFNETTNERDQVRAKVGLRNYIDSPHGNLFANLLVEGPKNFNDADGRSLYVRDFLIINPSMTRNNPDGVIDTLNEAIVANNARTGSTRGPISDPTSSQGAFFEISEETQSLYAQANFEKGMFSGNVGLRHIDTEVASTGYQILDGEGSLETSKGSYDHLLTRANLRVDARDDLVVRASYAEDISRPGFDSLSTAVTYSTSPNTTVKLGNPGLEPEEIEAFDISLDWYFAPAAVLSVGHFNKKRTGLFFDKVTDVTTTTVATNDGFVNVRETDPSCPGGGVFNPVADMNVFAPVVDGEQISGVGICVPFSNKENGSGENTQKGIEIALQYDLSNFENQLGWGSGFGFVLNYTTQDFDGNGDDTWSASTRAKKIFEASGGAVNPEMDVTLLDLSDEAYNLTVFYEKYGISARARYTWRSAYRSDDFGSTSSFPLGFPVVQEDRGQLNASINYDVNDQVNIGLEIVNLTESDVRQSCVNEGAVLCYEGLTDRRILVGLNYTY